MPAKMRFSRHFHALLCATLVGVGCGDGKLSSSLDNGAPLADQRTGHDQEVVDGLARDMDMVDGATRDQRVVDGPGSDTKKTDGSADLAPPPDASHDVTGGLPAPTYTPLVVDDFEEGTAGQNSPWMATGSMVYDSAHAHSGSKSVRISFRHLQNGYGGTKNMPQGVTAGETVWYRVYLYMPSTLSLSYGDTQGDGFGWNKFMVMSQYDHGAPRMYVQPASAYKVDYGQPNFYATGLYVNHGDLGAYCQLKNGTYTFPRDRWFALQMAWKVETNTSAWIRVWSDQEFVGECAGGGQVPSGYEVHSFGIGNYWNGGAWIQGGSTADFWIDDVVVTKQRPNTTDAGGRPYIHPEHFR